MYNFTFSDGLELRMEGWELMFDSSNPTFNEYSKMEFLGYCSPQWYPNLLKSQAVINGVSKRYAVTEFLDITKDPERSDRLVAHCTKPDGNRDFWISNKIIDITDVLKKK